MDQQNLAVRPVETIQWGAYFFNLWTRRVWVEGAKPIRLKGPEAALFRRLAEGRGEPVSREDLMATFEDFTGRPCNPNTKLVDVHLSHLRNSLEPLKLGFNPVVPERKFGYRLVQPPSAAPSSGEPSARKDAA